LRDSQVQWYGSVQIVVVSISPTSTKIKFTSIKSEKPKATINLQAVGEIMIEGSTFKTLEAIMGSMNIPTIVHRTFDRNAIFFGNASLNLLWKFWNLIQNWRENYPNSLEIS
jgi:hypothetical protein